MRACLAIALVLAGCNDDVDLSGIYEVQSEVASEPCGGDAPVQDALPYVKFAKSEFFGTTVFNYQGCRDAAGTDCDASGGLFDSLSEPIDDGWLGHLTSSSGTPEGGTCALSLRDVRATLVGDHLVIDEEAHAEDIPYAQATCTTDEAERRGTDMPCTRHHRIEAVKR